jgi:uncharacterized protein
MRRSLALLALAAGFLPSFLPGTAGDAAAQARKGKEFAQADRDRLNASTVSVISGNPNGTYLFMAYDLAAVLDKGDTLRVLPIVGKGGYQNVTDLLFLKGVDVGITQSNILSHLRKTGEYGSNIDKRLVYIAKLYNEELHILAGQGIESINDLKGKTVNFSDVGSGTQFSTKLIFAALGIDAKEINVGQADAFTKLRSGEIAATVLIAGKPAGSWGRLKLEPGMKILPVPYTEALEADYFPSKLSHEDYPDLIPSGTTVDTVAVGAVLATINWSQDSERYRRVSRFTEAFLENFPEFKKKPRHAKWLEVNLATELPGWTRFAPAKQWLDSRPPAAAAAAAGSAPTRAQFEQFLALQKGSSPNGVQAADPAMFQKFLDWVKTTTPPAARPTGAPAPAAPSGTRLW